MKRKIFGIMLVSLMICLVSVGVLAHEFSPSIKWYNVQYNSSAGNYYAAINSTVVNLNSTYTNAYTGACTAWNNYSNANVLIEPYNSLPRVIVRSDYWNSTWPVGGFAATASTIESNQVTWATVYINSATTFDWTDKDKQKTIVHEFGHVLGFNETNDGTISVMKQGQGSTLGISNYWLPQTHDKSDVTNKY